MNLAMTTPHETVSKLIKTNLIGTIYSCQLFAPLLIRQRKGLFVNFSSIAVALAIKGEVYICCFKSWCRDFF